MKCNTTPIAIPAMIICHGSEPDVIPEVNVAIKFACGKPNGGFDPVIANCGDKITIIPVTITTPTMLEIKK